MIRERQDQSCKCGHREYEHGLDGVCDEEDCRCRQYRPTYQKKKYRGDPPGYWDFEKQKQPRRCDG